MKKQKNIIVFVMSFASRYVDHIKSFEEAHNKKYRILVLWDSKLKKPENTKHCDFFVECDFSQPSKIGAALMPYQEELMAITCRTEQNLARFAQIIPNVPYLRTPTTESLKWAADKYEMRKRLKAFDPKNTPRFTRVNDASKKERERVISKVNFPMIVKPANLAGSLFVSICYHEEELEQTLRRLFKRIKTAYQNDTRLEEPKVIAEEYMEGDLYSLDSYVDSRGNVYHCPLVRQKTAKEIGRDDFYNYLQITPSALKKSTVEKAQQVAENAIHALALRSVTAHTELMKVDDEWKVIEVGPRPGGMRDTLHSLSCDINHTMNDIAVRIPRKPIIPKKCKGYAAYVKYFAAKEGAITEMKGIKKIEEVDSFKSININKKIGDRAVFARNGGRAVFTAILYNSDRSKLLADIRRIEQMVDIKVASGNGKTAKKTATKAAKPKTVKTARSEKTAKPKVAAKKTTKPKTVRSGKTT